MIGQTVSHYRVVAELGRGGMGVVYLAEDLRLRRFVALKMLPPAAVADADARRLLIKEAMAASALDHPNVCTVHEIDDTTDGGLFIVMAYQEGEDLARRLARGALPLREALIIAAQVADGLAQAHASGIVHRDIKPANIYLTTGGHVKILDFGVAKLTGDPRSTVPGTLLGTPAYMAPEQARGGDIDGRTDVWAFGAMLYEMLTGEIAGKDPPPPSRLVAGLPPLVDTICAVCLAKSPDDRYPTAARLLTDLRRALRALEEPQGLTQPLEPAPRRQRRLPTPLVAILAVVVLAAVAPTLWRLRPGGSGATPPRGAAVLPFSYVGGDSLGTLMSAGLTDDLTERLSQLPDRPGRAWVLPASIVRGREIRGATEARRILGAGVVLDGRLEQLAPGVIRLTLIQSGPNDEPPVTKIFTDRLENLELWEHRVLAAAAGLLGIETTAPRMAALAGGTTTSADALNHYLVARGRLCAEAPPRSQLAAAVADLETAVAADSSFTRAQAALAGALWRLGRGRDPGLVARAEQIGRRVVARDGRYFPGRFALADILRGSGRTQEALQCLREARAWDYPVLRETARLLETTGDLKAAEDSLLACERRFPGFVLAHNALGAFYVRQNRLSEAIPAFERVLELAPDYYPACNNLGSIHFYRGDLDAAQRWFEQSLAARKNAVAYANLGTLAFFDSRFADARQMYNEALKLADDDFRVWEGLAAAAQWEGDRPAALRAYARAADLAQRELERDPNNAGVAIRLALDLEHLGRREEAERRLAQVTTAAITDAEARFHAAELCELLGRRREALDWLAQSLSAGFAASLVDRAPGLRNLRADPRFRELVTTNPAKGGN